MRASSNVASLCNICHFLSHYLFDTIFNLFKRITSRNKKSLQNNDATLQVLGLTITILKMKVQNALASSSTLQKLYLHNDNIGVYGAECLVYALAMNSSTLQSLAMFVQ